MLNVVVELLYVELFEPSNSLLPEHDAFVVHFDDGTHKLALPVSMTTENV